MRRSRTAARMAASTVGPSPTVLVPSFHVASTTTDAGFDVSTANVVARNAMTNRLHMGADGTP